MLHLFDSVSHKVFYSRDVNSMRTRLELRMHNLRVSDWLNWSSLMMYFPSLLPLMLMVIINQKVIAQYQFAGQHVSREDLTILLRVYLWLVRKLVPIEKLCLVREVADRNKPWRRK